MRRLSGGNQQKVTIARWVAGGVRTMLCFDPTRGIDIGTKRQIYELLRDLADGRRRGPALHLGAQGDPARLRPGHRHLRRARRRRDRRSRTPTRRRCCAPRTTCRPMPRCPRTSPRPSSPRVPRMSAAVDVVADARARAWPTPPRAGRGATAGRSGWSRCSAGFLVFTTLIGPGYGAPEIQNLAIGALPIALAAVAQAIVVISGGIDLSVGSIMALDERHVGGPDEGPGRGVRGRGRRRRPAARARRRRDQRLDHRHHPGPGHRRHAGHVLRLGRGDPARPRLAWRRRRRAGSRA